MTLLDDSMFFIIVTVFLVGIIAFIKVAVIDEKKDHKK
jgi:hypothetical protein